MFSIGMELEASPETRDNIGLNEGGDEIFSLGSELKVWFRSRDVIELNDGEDVMFSVGIELLDEIASLLVDGNVVGT